MLTLSDVVYRIGGRRLLDRANAQIYDGAKVGLVGRNGVGKSTLLDLIRGVLLPEDGTIELPHGHRIGFLSQEAPSGAATPLATVLAADDERTRLLAEREACAEPLRLAEIETRLGEIHAHSAPGRAARILAGLGLDATMQHLPLDDLSGGWRMRTALAAILFAEPDLLLLDEPTNHLDLEAALWLERFLRNYRQTLILVSHDRSFLNAVTSLTLHLERGRLTTYSGGFDAFLRARREGRERLEKLARTDARERQRLQAFVDRFRAKASKASQVQSRLKALARFEPIVLSAEEPPPRIDFPQPLQLKPPLITTRAGQRRLYSRQIGAVASRFPARSRGSDRPARSKRQRQDDVCPAARRTTDAVGRADDPLAKTLQWIFCAASDRGNAPRSLRL